MEKQTLFESRVKRAEELFVSHDTRDIWADIRVSDRGRSWANPNPNDLCLVFFFSRIGDHHVCRGEFRVQFAPDTDTPLICTMVAAPSLLESRIQAANAKYDVHDFGPGVRVVGDRGWSCTNPTDLVLVFSFVRGRGRGKSRSDNEPHRGAFHVQFDPDGDMPVNAYAIDLASGEVIGQDPGACEHNPGP